MIDFGQVMVFGCQPENRDAVHSLSRRPSRQLDRREAFTNREERPPEKPHLLTRNHTSRASAEPFNVVEGSCRCVQVRVLAFEDLGYALPTVRFVLDCLCFFSDPL